MDSHSENWIKIRSNLFGQICCISFSLSLAELFHCDTFPYFPPLIVHGQVTRRRSLSCGGGAQLMINLITVVVSCICYHSQDIITANWRAKLAFRALSESLLPRHPVGRFLVLQNVVFAVEKERAEKVSRAFGAEDIWTGRARVLLASRFDPFE